MDICLPEDPKGLTVVEFTETSRWTQLIVKACEKVQDTVVYTWGDGRDGALAHGESRVRKEPKAVSGLKDEGICAVSAGWKMSLFLNEQGQVFQSGKLFNCSGAAAMVPERVVFTKSVIVQTIAAGLQAAYAVTQNGRVYSWGIGKNGQLGHGDEDLDDLDQPREIAALTKEFIVKISTGIYFTIALTSTGRVYSWGKSNYGQLGHAIEDYCGDPQQIDDLDQVFVLDIAAGDAHVLALGDVMTEMNGQERSLWTWGKNIEGCMGLSPETIPFAAQPTEIVTLRGHYIEKIAAGSDHSLVLTCSGIKTYVFSFGSNACGQLGTEGTITREIPRQIRELNGVRVVSIAAGARYSVALSNSGEVYSWGDAMYNKTGQYRTTMVPWISDPLLRYSAVAVAAGKDHVILLARRDSKHMDRFRQFRIDELPLVTSVMTPCTCTHTGLTLSMPCYLMYVCKTCSNQELCRLCARHCHTDHELSMSFNLKGMECKCTIPSRMFLPSLLEE